MSEQRHRSLLSPDKLRDMLDSMVDGSCEQFYETWLESPPFPFDPETGDLISPESDEADEALMRLVFYSDARAQADNDQFNVVSNIAWVDMARQGITRMGRRLDNTRDLRRLRIFVCSDLAMQAEAYRDMADRRVTERGASVHHSCTGYEYATLVAIGAVVLEKKSPRVS